MVEILTFQQALDKSSNTKRNLLLGNGFSIACDSSIFNYESLYAEAAQTIQETMPEVHALFEQLGTKDFEAVIHMLQNANAVLPFYQPSDTATAERMLEHANQLKEILITTIAQNHPDFPSSIPEEKFTACRKFLSHFINADAQVKGKVYTLNYDLLLYWVLMHDDAEDEEITLLKNDGFGKDEPEDDYIIWKNESHTQGQHIFYLHGAVHLFDTGTELEKHTWINSGKRLVDQAREALENNKFPLFVAEGKYWHKLQKIKHDPYLHHCYKSFLGELKEDRRKTNAQKSLFIFGHSLDSNDDHIIQKIGKGKNSHLYVSIYGDQQSEDNQHIINKARALGNLREAQHSLEVSFYDAASAEVWG